MKEKNVIDYYVTCNKLKNVIRSGWTVWHIKRDRVESVAEHIYNVQMLAIAMYSEYAYDIDIMKVIMMLAVHELEEIVIGDIPVTDPDHINKMEIGHKAVCKILENLADKDRIKELVFEFDERKTNEAVFAYHCDKLECDLQAKLYDEEGCFDLTEQQDNYEYNSFEIQNLIANGASTFTEMWYHTDEKLYQDQNFIDVFNYAKNNKISIDE